MIVCVYHEWFLTVGSARYLQFHISTWDKYILFLVNSNVIHRAPILPLQGSCFCTESIIIYTSGGGCISETPIGRLKDAELLLKQVEHSNVSVGMVDGVCSLCGNG